MSDVALIVVDMLNSYEHEDADALAESVSEVVDTIAELIDRARQRGDVDVIYVNDNYGDFTANFSDLIDAAMQGERPDLVKPILPAKGCRMMSKVRHSAFYSTPLEYLLNRLCTKRLILTGQVTEQCILYSALDAFVRHYQVLVPMDAVAHIDADLGGAALRMMEKNMDAELLHAADCFDRI
jgi:nicotinamidase-related amidase